MKRPIELTDAETAAVAGGLLNNIFVNTAPNSNSFNTNSGNVLSAVGNTNSGNVASVVGNIFSFLSNNGI